MTLWVLTSRVQALTPQTYIRNRKPQTQPISHPVPSHYGIGSQKTILIMGFGDLIP